MNPLKIARFDYMTALEQLTMSRNPIARLEMMVGAKDFMFDSSEDSIAFKFKGSSKANYLEIKLDRNDTYTMTFMKLRGMDFKTVKEIDGVYNDMLKNIFEETTGLYLSI